MAGMAVLVLGDAVEDAARDGHQDAAHKGRSKAGDGDADAQQVDRQVARELKHKAVDDKLENAQRNDRERQRDDRKERFDERIDNVQTQASARPKGWMPGTRNVAIAMAIEVKSQLSIKRMA